MKETIFAQVATAASVLKLIFPQRNLRCSRKTRNSQRLD